MLFRTWPFAFAHVRLMHLLDPPAPNGTVTRKLAGFPLSLQIEPRSYMGRFLYYRGMYEEPMINKLCSALRPGMTFVDVGANIGLYTVIAGHLVGPHGRVLAVEPQSALTPILEANVQLNRLPNVTICRCALASGGGTGLLHQIHTKNAGLATLQLGAHEKGISEETVPLRPLDEVISENHLRRVDGIKIDVEGAELEVLAGAGGLFRTRPPRFVLVECIDEHLQRFGASSYDLLSWLQSKGYRLSGYRGGRWKPLSPARGLREDVFAARHQS